jgi:hypothetical protein
MLRRSRTCLPVLDLSPVQIARSSCHPWLLQLRASVTPGPHGCAQWPGGLAGVGEGQAARWDSRKGRDFEDVIFANYMSSVHFPSSSLLGAFHLLVVFCRYTFRLTDVSVSLALHSCLGGMPASFHVQFLKDRHYHILVASKRVGFAVTDLKRITTSHFDVYFHLWRGGANWQREWSKWVREEEAS